jgi:hypothetical protein
MEFRILGLLPQLIHVRVNGNFHVDAFSIHDREKDNFATQT